MAGWVVGWLGWHLRIFWGNFQLTGLQLGVLNVTFGAVLVFRASARVPVDVKGKVF